MPRISDAKILMIATDGFEDSELMEPRRRLLEKGAKVTLASLDTKEIEGDKGARIKPDLAIEGVNDADYDALVLPGGTKNPDKLRVNGDVVSTVRRFVESGRPVAAICHGPWLLVEADLLRGRNATSWASIRTDLRNAGANVVDEAAVTDGNLVTSRKPDDVEAFTNAVIDLIENAPEVTEIREVSEIPA